MTRPSIRLPQLNPIVEKPLKGRRKAWVMKTDAGMAIGHPDERVPGLRRWTNFHLAAQVPPTPGEFVIDVHGKRSAPVALVAVNGKTHLDKWDVLTAKTVAALVEDFWRTHGFAKPQKIRLDSCYTASSGFAQELADRLGIPVTATRHELTSHQDGTAEFNDPDTGASVGPPLALETFGPRPERAFGLL